MNAGTLLLIAGDVIALLAKRKVLLPDGRFDSTLLDTLQEDLEFIADIESILFSYGLNVPEKLGAVLKLLPAVAALVK